jgi:hypothetical protein
MTCLALQHSEQKIGHVYERFGERFFERGFLDRCFYRRLRFFSKRIAVFKILVC